MTIWTSNPLLALGFVTMLGACDTTTTGNTLLAGLTPPADAALPPVPLTQAMMMRGSVTLVPPTGYCIDPETLSQSFALMARCDSLGAASGGEGVPAGVLSVSFARNGSDPQIPTAQELAAAVGTSSPEEIRQTDAGVMFKANGKAPSPDLSTTHWRSVTKVGGFTMGASLFGPEGRRVVSGEGATLLEEMIQRTTAKTNAA